MNRVGKKLRNLVRNSSGTAAVEFALSMPFLLTAGLYGAETANLALVNMKVSQMAIHIADNASRIGDTSQITNRKIFEGDVNDLLYGSHLQGGPSLDFYERGRTIISSYEVFDTSVSCAGGACSGGPISNGAFFIHWQRCKGKKVWPSSYGTQHDVLPSGMGPVGYQVTPEVGGAVIFVEVAYDYKPLVSQRFFGPTTITAVSSFVVRDNIDLSGLKQRKPFAPDAPSSCNLNTGYSAVGGGSSSGGGSGGSTSSTSSSSGGSSTSGGGSSSGGWGGGGGWGGSSA